MRQRQILHDKVAMLQLCCVAELQRVSHRMRIESRVVCDFPGERLARSPTEESVQLKMSLFFVLVLVLNEMVLVLLLDLPAIRSSTSTGCA